MLETDHTVDVGIVGDLGGRDHPIEELNSLHGHHASAKQEQQPGDDEADPLQDDDRLIADVIGKDEHGQQQHQVRVGPNWKDLVCDL